MKAHWKKTTKAEYQMKILQLIEDLNSLSTERSTEADPTEGADKQDEEDR